MDYPEQIQVVFRAGLELGISAPSPLEHAGSVII